MPKAKKRSESTLHRDEVKAAPSVSKVASELGLSVPLPSVLTKTRAEAKVDKVQAKKDKTQRIKAALTSLETRAEEVQEHRKFVEAEKEREKQETRIRKIQRQAEHVAARTQREAAAEARDVDLKKRQAAIVAEHLETLKQRERAERKAFQQEMKELSRRAAVEPKAVHIAVKRTPEVQAVRDSLPVTAEEQPIMEAVESSKGGAVIVCGETGSGKTTQVPQFLWEAGYGHPEGAAAFRDGMIAVTEPRRVAAINMARRVAEELNETFGDTVCYHVRYQNNLSERCKLKFMTEGILLKEMQSDFMLRRYSAIVVDEAHERSVSCDMLVGLLSRIVPLRQALYEETGGEIRPLKLIIMSATLRVADFRDNTRLFPHPPPLIQVDVRRFPVTTHFARKTELHNYVDEAYKKVRQVHKKLPPGGMLVFLSTQREIDLLCKRLADHYRKTRIVYDDSRYSKHSLLKSRREGRKVMDGNRAAADGEGEESEDEYGLAKADYALDGDEDAAEGDEAAETFAGTTGLADDFDYGATRAANDSDSDDDARHAARAAQRIAEMAKRNAKPSGKGAPNVFAADDEASDWGDDDAAGTDAEEAEGENDEAASGTASVVDEDDDGARGDDVDDENEEDGELDTLHILPLYSLLDHRAQQRVFEPPPPGKRLCVIATNIAETSITIPNVRYVIDAGRVKNKTLQRDTQAQAFKIEWISQAGAEQRAGRAGRTGPGHCYRLYSTAVFSNLMPKHADPEIARTPLESVVLMMKHLKIDHVGNFPFPAPPDEGLIKNALLHLRRLGALDENFRCADLGSRLVALPVTPRYGVIILEAIRRFGTSAPQVVAAVITIMAVATATMDVFVLGGDAKPPKALLHPGSDFITFLRAFNAFAQNPSLEFCRSVAIVHKTMKEVAQLRRQIELLVADAESMAPATSTVDDEGVLGDFDSNEAIAMRPGQTAAAEPDAATESSPRRVRPENETGASASKEGVALADASAALAPHAATDELVVPEMKREEEAALRRLFISGLIDQVARRATVSECRDARIKYEDGKTTKTPYWDVVRQAVVFIHPSSSVAQTYPPPEWVVYSVLQRSARGEKGTKKNARSGEEFSTAPKVFMRGVTIVTKQWLDDAGFVEDEPPVEVDQAV